MTAQPSGPGRPCLRCIVGGLIGSLVAIWMLLMTFRGARGFGRRFMRARRS